MRINDLLFTLDLQLFAEGDTTVDTLLEKITALETRIVALEEENKKLKTDNDEIKSFNRKLLDGRVETKPNINSDKDKEQLEKYLKGE